MAWVERPQGGQEDVTCVCKVCWHAGDWQGDTGWRQHLASSIQAPRREPTQKLWLKAQGSASSGSLMPPRMEAFQPPTLVISTPQGQVSIFRNQRVRT